MNGVTNVTPRLQFLVRVVRKECRHLASALQTGHTFVAGLIATANNMIAEAERRVGRDAKQAKRGGI